MSDVSGAGEGPQPVRSGAADPSAGPPQFRLVSQYVKDLSFESPRVPLHLPHTVGTPKINISVNVNARSLDGERSRFEVELSLEARAETDGRLVFLAEVLYGGVLEVINVAEEFKPPLTMVEGPRLLFPFARRVLADMVRDGGFPPLLIEPIDFVALFRRHMAEVAGGQESVARAGD